MRTVRESVEHEGKFFEKLFELAEIAKFAPEERKNYESIMLTERDKQDLLAYARLQGVEEGMEKGMEKGMKKGMEKKAIDTARVLKASGVDSEIIAKATGLDPEAIAAL